MIAGFVIFFANLNFEKKESYNEDLRFYIHDPIQPEPTIIKFKKISFETKSVKQIANKLIKSAYFFPPFIAMMGLCLIYFVRGTQLWWRVF
jgi:hypothetical protein